jgi:hypothetical protein
LGGAIVTHGPLLDAVAVILDRRVILAAAETQRSAAHVNIPKVIYRNADGSIIPVGRAVVARNPLLNAVAIIFDRYEIKAAAKAQRIFRSHTRFRSHQRQWPRRPSSPFAEPLKRAAHNCDPEALYLIVK